MNEIGFGPWGILFMVVGLVFLLGFFFDWVEITLIVLPYLLYNENFRFCRPCGSRSHNTLDSRFIGCKFTDFFSYSSFWVWVFYMKGVAPSGVKIQTIYKGIIPFVMLQLVGLALVIKFPEIAFWLPSYFRLILFSLLFFANHVVLSMDNVKSELTLQEAHSLYINKNLTIIDVRTINEWKMTGIIPTSILINMHDDKYQERKGFVTEITKILLEYQDKNIAFICASGARSKIITIHDPHCEVSQPI